MELEKKDDNNSQKSNITSFELLKLMVTFCYKSGFMAEGKGGNVGDIATFFKDDIKSILKEKNQERYLRITNGYKVCSNSVERNMNYVSLLKNHPVLYIDEEIKFFGDIVYFSVGDFKKEDEAHAFLLKVEKKSETEFELTIFNTLGTMFPQDKIAKALDLNNINVSECNISKRKTFYKQISQNLVIGKQYTIKVKDVFDQNIIHEGINLNTSCSIGTFVNFLDCLEKEQNEVGLKERVYNIFKTKIEKLEKKKPFNTEDPNKTLEQQKIEELKKE